MLGSVDDIAHIIQTALTPAFLLAGLATLLAVFSNRLDRVADQVEHLARRLNAADQMETSHCCRQLAHLRRRTKFLDAAVVLGALGGGLTCVATLLLFVGGFGNAAMAAAIVLATFGLALALTIGSIGAFLIEMLLSSRSLRTEASVQQKVAESRELDATLQRVPAE